MSQTKCPFCSASLPASEIAEGWCESCGKKLPSSLLGPASAATATRPNYAPMRENGPPPQPAGPTRPLHWGYWIGAVLAVVAGSVLVSLALFDAGPRSASTSRKGRALEQLLGERGTEAATGLVLMGLGIYLAVKSAQNTRTPAKLFSGATVILGLAAPLAIWGADALKKANELAALQKIADEAKPIAEQGSSSGDPLALKLRQKVLVWDHSTKELSPAHQKLPQDRRAKSTDSPMTVVLILRTQDEQTETYDSGEPGYRRDMTIGVVDWPEKTPLGVFQVRGNAPGLLVMRPADEKGPIIGDTAEPLKEWLLEQATQK